MKYSLVQGQVRYSEGNRAVAELKRGMSVDDDHPLVLERPDLFSDQAPDAELSARPAVERATAAPGEKRTTARKAATKPGAAGAKGGSSE
ncbi:hypothetical protein PV728_01700 [Streptomyces europaeiscabiei]|uniref:hypothetical protein n=1 Tax=Streptomyces europaeiscabiei TaxID=146819 RepID=UPI0029AB417A|nr:hypothetical protein [Streptomyces europaeiscabiei]MDX3629043.1 hypothetical protein [Streptomyces europaeiscabiei]MDX3647339.1 hypothetical protein [Streptomyces europaeiscabiei]